MPRRFKDLLITTQNETPRGRSACTASTDLFFVPLHFAFNVLHTRHQSSEVWPTKLCCQRRLLLAGAGSNSHAQRQTQSSGSPARISTNCTNMYLATLDLVGQAQCVGSQARSAAGIIDPLPAAIYIIPAKTMCHNLRSLYSIYPFQCFGRKPIYVDNQHSIASSVSCPRKTTEQLLHLRW